jgi:hypothetical protein
LENRTGSGGAETGFALGVGFEFDGFDIGAGDADAGGGGSGKSAIAEWNPKANGGVVGRDDVAGAAVAIFEKKNILRDRDEREGEEKGEGENATCCRGDAVPERDACGSLFF